MGLLRFQLHVKIRQRTQMYSLLQFSSSQKVSSRFGHVERFDRDQVMGHPPNKKRLHERVEHYHVQFSFTISKNAMNLKLKNP